MIYSLFRFGNKGQKWVKKSVILGVNGLTHVLKKNSPFVWTEKQQIAFDTLKQKLCEEPLLQRPDFSKSFILLNFYTPRTLSDSGRKGRSRISMVWVPPLVFYPHCEGNWLPWQDKFTPSINSKKNFLQKLWTNFEKSKNLIFSKTAQPILMT